MPPRNWGPTMPQDPLAAAIGDYLLALESEGRARATIATYRCALCCLADHAGPLAPAQLTPAVLRAWLKAMAEAGLAPRSQRDYLSVAKSWIGWLADEEAYGLSQQQRQQLRDRVKPPPEVS